MLIVAPLGLGGGSSSAQPAFRRNSPAVVNKGEASLRRCRNRRWRSAFLFIVEFFIVLIALLLVGAVIL